MFYPSTVILILPSKDLFIQGVSEIRMLILTSGRTRQFIKLSSITFCKIRKSFPRFLAPQFFTKRVVLCD
jgi:hypothetical protein